MNNQRVATLFIIGFILTLTAVFLREPVLALINVYKHMEEYSHGYLVPLFALFLVYKKRNAWFYRGNAGRWLGLLVTACGILIILGAQWYNFALRPGGLGVEFLFGLALVVLAVGLCLAFGGFALLRLWAWPVGFLIFAVPFPISISNAITLPMRGFVTVTAGGILEVMSVPVVQQGNVLRLPNFTVGVVDACSGNRSLFVMLAMAGVLISLNKLNFGKALVLFAFAPVIAVMQNVIRVLATGLLGNAGLEQYTEGAWHDGIGMATFGISVAVFTCVALLVEAFGNRKSTDLSATEPVIPAAAEMNPSPRETGEPAAVKPKPAIPQHRGALIGLFVILAAGSAGGIVIERHYRILRPQLTERKPLYDFPDQFGPYRKAEEGRLGDMAREMLAPTEDLIRGYRDDDDRYYEFSVLFWEPFVTRSRPEGIRLHHPPDLCYSGGGWHKIPEYDRAFTVPGFEGQIAELRIYRGLKNAQALLFWKTPYPDLGFIEGNIWSRFVQIARSWTDPPLNTGSHWSLMIVTNVVDTPEEAHRVLVRFLENVAPIMPVYGIPPQTEEQDNEN